MTAQQESASVGIAVMGAGGRMGRILARIVADTGSDAPSDAPSDVHLVGAVVRPGHRMLGRDAAALWGGEDIGIVCTDNAPAAIAQADAVIDFTVPEALAWYAELSAQAGAAYICGTTGLDATHTAVLDRAAVHIPVFSAANTALGVNVLARLVAQAARQLGADFDIEIAETHHRMKRDAPSGTALMLGQAAAAGRGVDHDACAAVQRDGVRAGGVIGYAANRGGDVVGEHRVMFLGAGERLELGHKASDRGIYARGAVRAAVWAHRQPPGRYGMADMLADPPGQK